MTRRRAAARTTKPARTKRQPRDEPIAQRLFRDSPETEDPDGIRWRLRQRADFERVHPLAEQLAESFAAAKERDRETAQIRGGVRTLERQGRRRADVWRTLQAIADRYRLGLPLDEELWLRERADAILTAELGQDGARALITEAEALCGSQAKYPRNNTRKKQNKARKRVKVWPALPADVLDARALSRAELLTLAGSEAEATDAWQALERDREAIEAWEDKAGVTAPRCPVTTPE